MSSRTNPPKTCPATPKALSALMHRRRGFPNTYSRNGRTVSVISFLGGRGSELTIWNAPGAGFTSTPYDSPVAAARAALEHLDAGATPEPERSRA